MGRGLFLRWEPTQEVTTLLLSPFLLSVDGGYHSGGEVQRHAAEEAELSAPFASPKRVIADVVEYAQGR